MKATKKFTIKNSGHNTWEVREVETGTLFARCLTRAEAVLYTRTYWDPVAQDRQWAGDS